MNIKGSSWVSKAVLVEVINIVFISYYPTI